MKSLAKAIVLASLAFASAAWAKPDLVISYVTLSKSTAYPGDDIRIDSGTKNNGDATGWWKYCTVNYYFGTRTNDFSNQIGSGATPNYNEVNGIDSGEVEEDTISSWTIPANTRPGTYYIICKADAENDISESNENNNTLAAKLVVKGIPAFTNVQWNCLRQLTDGETAVAYGECVNIDPGSWVTVNIYEDDVAGDDLVASNLQARVVRGTNGVCYFAKTWAAKWIDDASSDPEYYFTCSYDTAEAESGTDAGALLNVAKAGSRMTPSCDKVNGQYRGFYFDNDISTNGVYSGPVGPSSGSVALTDDRIPIILVHGMSGDAKPLTLNYWYGWMNADNSDPNVPLGYFNQAGMSNIFRVYRYVYDSRDYISTNAAKFASFVTNFYANHPEFDGRQVVVMAHSMGGLVSRYAMNTNPDFASKVHRLVTLGSPHQGSQGANPTWIKYSGPDDDSWFISGIYNTFKLHNNTAGCFDLAWYALDQIPEEALATEAIEAMYDTYHPDLLRKSLQNPFCGWTGMKTTATHDYKMVMFGGSSTNMIGDSLRSSWPDDPSGEVKTDHMGLWAAAKIFRSMSYRNGKGVGDNDGLVPLNSALLSDSNRHPNTVKINLNDAEGQQVDHASYLDVAVTMDSVRTRLLTQVRGVCSPAAVANAARWRLVNEPGSDGPGPWQKSGVRLPALTPGVSYTIQFKGVSGYVTPSNVTVTAQSGVAKTVTGTYVASNTTAAVNRAPTSLSLSNASVDENAPAGTVVGTLSATDPDSGDTFTYSLVSGAGDTGNSCFSISGNQLKTTVPFDYEEYPAHYCRIRVTDSGTNHLYLDQEFTIAVNNLPDTPAELSGDAWLNLAWDPVDGASAYRVDVTACGANGTTYKLHDATLYTNKFKSGHKWKYILPDGAPSSSKGAVTNAPIYATYSDSSTNIAAHFLVGTNGIGIQTANFSVNGAPSATLSLTNGAWNGGGKSERSILKAYCSFDNGASWTPLGESQPTSTADYGEVGFSRTVSLFGESNVTFKIEAPNACTLSNYLRGTYVSAASVTLASTNGNFSSTGCELDGFPVETAETSLRVPNLQADTPYWYTVQALVGDSWTTVASGVQQSYDGHLAVPQNPRLADAASTELEFAWDSVANADGYIVQLTSVTAAGTPSTLSTCPNVSLVGDANDSGWSYAANHRIVASNWFYPMANNPAGDYHALTVQTTPGLQSPPLDLSGCSEASLNFVMRRRGSNTTATVWLYWSADGQTWHKGSYSSATNEMIYNYLVHSIPVPEEALVSNVRLELCVTDATGTTKNDGNGAGIRNLALTATPRGGPDFEAASVVEDLATETSFRFTDLDPDTAYWFRVRAVDNDWNLSDWSSAVAATTATNRAPFGLFVADEGVDEKQPVGTLVGLMEATDPDGDPLTYELVPGTNDTDNASFYIVGDELFLAETLAYTNGSVRHIRIRAADPFDGAVEASFAIEVKKVADDVTVSVEPTLAPAAGGAFQLGWEPVAGVTKYEVYISTNLSEQPPFKYFTTLTNTTALTDDVDGTVKFWVIRPVQ